MTIASPFVFFFDFHCFLQPSFPVKTVSLSAEKTGQVQEKLVGILCLVLTSSSLLEWPEPIMYT